MAVGAGDNYWRDNRLPGILKHRIIRRYLPLYLARTSSKDGRAVYIDGYAGRGFYENGEAGSAGLLMEFALEAQGEYILRLFEKDKTNYEHLNSAAEKFAAEGVNVKCERGDIVDKIENTVTEADGLPLFLFLDPCGVGLPFEMVVSAMNRPAAGEWPPTELLMNFSWEAIRRIGGHVSSPRGSEKTLKRLDTALGGDWWREHFLSGTSDEAVEAVVDGFINRLGAATNCSVASLPVRRKPSHKPIYSLVYATRSPRGFWHFADITAKSLEDVRIAHEALAEPGFFSIATPQQDAENAALPDIEKNILSILEKRSEFIVGDFPFLVFGEHIGTVGEKIVRKAIKSLHRQGRTPSTGVGGKTENLKVVRPKR
ncbi:three-Cys-motif partner protein TcmP [Rhodococcus sp. EPR-134]|uniref:three-Cys-motif partner protein TcmP n=1 Tax=Rhodococcus sp. EPR-134 TaxID=1813675 RepID=UPI0007BB9D52|nr:three-Cys-motif partner protein TcmP [Rhodococcus sp. EPR-134]KZF16994.1 hypothetical protein A2J01_01330 [Rhodococcus sp. EPR-134]